MSDDIHLQFQGLCTATYQEEVAQNDDEYQVDGPRAQLLFVV